MDPMRSVPGSEPAGDDDTDDERGERLLRRWLREREARHEAERIAEAGLRRLYEANADLDRRVSERTAELEAARALAEGADRTKSEFLANLGHEVRTPLHTVLATLELATPVDDADRRRLDDAILATRGLRDMFTNLLELAQFEVGSASTNLASVPLDQVVDELVDTWRSRLASKGLLLVPECPSGPAALATTDRDRVTQALSALLDNAEKFAEPGTVRLSVRCPQGWVELVVADDGPGIDDELLDKVFEPFARAGTPGDGPGSGVGLTIVRRIAEHLGGTAVGRHSASGGFEVEVRVPDAGTAPGSGTSKEHS
ncbi:MAG: sensor histidine kinase [Actinomycetes bacterium]